MKKNIVRFSMTVFSIIIFHYLIILNINIFISLFIVTSVFGFMYKENGYVFGMLISMYIIVLAIALSKLPVFHDEFIINDKKFVMYFILKDFCVGILGGSISSVYYLMKKRKAFIKDADLSLNGSDK